VGMNKARWAGVAAISLVIGLLAPVVVAPAAQAAAPVISTTTVLAAGATGPAGAAIRVSGDGFRSGIALGDFTVGGSGSGMTVAGVTRQDASNVTFILTGTALLNGTIEITAKPAAYTVDPGVDSNTLTITVVAPPTPATIVSDSVLVVGSTNPVINIDVTNTQVSFSAVNSGSFTVNVGSTGLTLSSAFYDGRTGAILNFTGTVTAGTLTVAAADSILNPATGGTTNTLSFTAAAQPVISSGSSIANGAVNPTVTILGNNFSSSITDDSLTVTTGTSGLTYASVTRVNSGELTVSFTGTAATGTVSIQAKATAFDPAETIASNTVSISVPSPPPTGDVLVSGPGQSPTITPSTISVAVGGTFVIANQSMNQSYFVRSATGSVSRGGVTCSNQTPCMLNANSSFTLLVDAQGTISVGGGTLTIGTAPGPNPGPTPTPPSAPTEAKAESGDRSATVTWAVPETQGSFPVSTYQVQTTPSAPGCLVQAPVTSCSLSGLTNGTTYGVQVRALSGAGWGPWANAGSVTPSAKPSPEARIVIAGTRTSNERVVLVEGSTTDLAGRTVQSWLRLSGESEFARGSTRVVGTDGTFEWQRRTGKRVQVYFTVGNVTSNTVSIAARL
jgi:hypothetical protein